MNPERRTALAREAAQEIGFDLTGAAPLAPPAAAGRFRAWLAAGRHAGMGWLERQADRIADPRQVLQGGRSLLILGLGHARRAVELSGGGRVARYAAGRDYHNVAGKMLRKLARRLNAGGLTGRSRGIVDAGPLLERSHAAEAGLGFESKAANLLHPDHGPWFFLAELLLEDELEPTRDGPPAGSCGSCTACLDVCPTGAIVEPGLVDAGLCISYHTIENRGHVPRELRASFEGWVFGCDLCSEVCPWGSDAADRSERFGLHKEVEQGSLVDWLRTPPDAFRERFRGSPLQRPGRDGLARNAAFALAHAPSDAGREALATALESDGSPLVREAAAWALAQAHGSDRGVRAALEQALGRAEDPDELAGLRDALERSDS